MKNIGDAVIKFLGEKIKQRYVVEAADLFELFSNMGILEDIDSMSIVLEHLENENVDVHFGVNESENYEKFKKIEKIYKFMKTTNINKDKVTSMMKKIDMIKPKLDTSWMEPYRQIENEIIEETIEEKPASSSIMNPNLANLQETLVEESTNKIISELNQTSDEERLLFAMERLNELHNIINNQ